MVDKLHVFLFGWNVLVRRLRSVVEKYWCLSVITRQRTGWQ